MPTPSLPPHSTSAFTAHSPCCQCAFTGFRFAVLLSRFTVFRRAFSVFRRAFTMLPPCFAVLSSRFTVFRRVFTALTSCFTVFHRASTMFRRVSACIHRACFTTLQCAFAACFCCALPQCARPAKCGLPIPPPPPPAAPRAPRSLNPAMGTVPGLFPLLCAPACLGTSPSRPGPFVHSQPSVSTTAAPLWNDVEPMTSHSVN